VSIQMKRPAGTSRPASLNCPNTEAIINDLDVRSKALLQLAETVDPNRLDTDLLDERRARAEELPLSLAWYRRKRLMGDGPPFIRIGSRVFYRRGELRRWIADHREAE